MMDLTRMISMQTASGRRMSDEDSEKITVTPIVDDASRFPGAQIAWVSESDAKKTQRRDIPADFSKVVFQVPAGHRYHMEYTTADGYKISTTKTPTYVSEVGNVRSFSVSYSILKATITVNYPSGATVTCTNGDTVYKVSAGTSHTFTVYKLGTWTLKATRGDQTDTKTVSITDFGQAKNATLAFFEATITVSYPVGAAVTCTLGSEVLRATNTGGNYTFKVKRAGTWTVKAVQGAETTEQSVAITRSGQAESVTLAFVTIYGIERDFTKPSPLWTRTDAAVGKTATASVGSTAGHSDFDTCYPWSEMKRETLSTGDVMVKIPEFYYQRTREGSIERIKIADKPVAGFEKHPGSGCYIGAYLSSDETAPNSKRGGGQRRASWFREQSKGVGWSGLTLEVVSAMQMLYLTEFANNNLQGMKSPESFSITNGDGDSIPGLTGSTKRGYGITAYRGVEMWFNGFEVQLNNNGIELKSSRHSDYGYTIHNPSVRVKVEIRDEMYVQETTYLDDFPWIMLPLEGNAYINKDEYYASEFSGNDSDHAILDMYVGYDGNSGVIGYRSSYQDVGGAPGWYCRLVYKKPN